MHTIKRVCNPSHDGADQTQRAQERYWSDYYQALAAAQHEAQQRSAEAASIEREAFTPRSSEVMGALLTHSRSARLKWFLLSLLQLLLELMPLILKAFSGVSPAGRAVAFRHATADATRRRAWAEREQEDIMFLAMKELSDRTAMNLVDSPAAQATMRAEHQRVLDALAALVGTQRFMKTIARHQEDVDELSQRHSSLASVFSSAWQAAVQRAAQAMGQLATTAST